MGNTNEPVKIAVLGKEALLGTCAVAIPAGGKYDQEEVLAWNTLRDQAGQELLAKLRVGVQYIYDMGKLAEMRIRVEEEKKQQYEEQFGHITDLIKTVSSKHLRAH